MYFSINSPSAQATCTVDENETVPANSIQATLKTNLVGHSTGSVKCTDALAKARVLKLNFKTD
jgi:hypothetical protein